MTTKIKVGDLVTYNDSARFHNSAVGIVVAARRFNVIDIYWFRHLGAFADYIGTVQCGYRVKDMEEYSG